jgi:hypothetical protein
MNSIASEPARLQAEQHRVKRELAAAAVEHYQVLVEAAERADAVASITARGVTHADACADSLAKLQAENVKLQEVGAQWRARKQFVSAATTNASRIAELLDAPATLEACIRSDMFHEARLVLDHVAALAEALPSSPVVARVSARVRDTLEALLQSTVLPRLRGSLSVTAALKITTFLRQLGVDQSELRVSFLAMRTDYICAFVAEEELVDGALPATLLKRVLAHWKVVVPEAIATFNSCFSESAPASREIGDWAFDRTTQLYDLWHKYILGVSAGVDLAELAAELSQCSLNWARAGIDISPLLIDSIAERVADVFIGSVRAGLESFLVALSSPSWRQTPMSAAGGPLQASPEGAPVAPARLVQCLPLAYVAHGVVTACNDIRRCAALAAWPACAAEITALSERVVDEIRTVRDEASHAAGESAAHDAIVSIALDDCIPFVCRCVDYVFDRTTLHDTVEPAAKLRFKGSA